MAATNGTYVYCLVRSDRKPSLAKAPSGLPGSAPPRAVAGPAGTWLIVADVPMKAYSGEAIDRHLKDLEWVSQRAMAHESVVEFCARAHDVVPMKLFTIFRDDTRATAHVGTAGSLPALFQRIAGCAEWSVRVSCSPPQSLRVSARRSTGARAESGIAFLQRKKASRDETRLAATRARQAVDDVFRKLDAVARRSVRKEGDVPGTSLILDAAFLVLKTKQPAFERLVGRLAASAAAAGCELVLSGPWPPYHFVSGS